MILSINALAETLIFFINLLMLNNTTRRHWMLKQEETKYAYVRLLMLQALFYGIGIITFIRLSDRTKEGYKVILPSYYTAMITFFIVITSLALGYLMYYLLVSNKKPYHNRILKITFIVTLPWSGIGLLVPFLLKKETVSINTFTNGFFEYFWSLFHRFIASVVLAPGLIIALITLQLHAKYLYAVEYVPLIVSSYAIEIGQSDVPDSIIYRYDRDDELDEVEIAFPVFSNPNEKLSLYIDDVEVCETTSYVTTDIPFFDCLITDKVLLDLLDDNPDVVIYDENGTVVPSELE